jgi:GNAT superfamily N-acetyltransferase/protein-L-isoaspartate O-methyltransferase
MITSNTKLKECVLSLYERLASTPSLRPTPSTNRFFTELVKLTNTTSANETAEILNDAEIINIIPKLRAICSEGEGYLESYWATKITADKHPAIALEDFPYYSNYLKLAELEYQSLSLIGNRRLKRILFVGSGSLPLSAILLAQQYGLIVDNIDNDAKAVETSSKLINRLGLGGVVSVMQADATSFTQYGEYDAIFLASLVGLDPTAKQAIIANIQRQMKQGGLMVARTAHGLRTLLYPPVDIDQIKGLKPQVIIQPLNEVVNSVIILEKPYTTILDELTIEDKHEPQTAMRFRQFCMEMITEVYQYTYNPAWHFDIDQSDTIYTRIDSNMFVVRHGNEVFAVAAIRPYDRDYSMFKGRYDVHTGSVWRFFIQPQFRGIGIEQMLEKQIETFAQQVGFNRLYTHDQRDVPGALQKYIMNGYAVTYESNDRFGTVHFEKDLEVIA